MKLKALLIGSLTLTFLSLSVNANDDMTTYSTEGYCLIKKSGESTGLLKAYAKKLGVTPSQSACKVFNEFVMKSQPKDWDYKGGKPYPGSALRLSPSQIKKLKASQ